MFWWRPSSKGAKRFCCLSCLFAAIFLLISSLSVSPLDDTNSSMSEEELLKLIDLKEYHPPDLNIDAILDSSLDNNIPQSIFDYTLGGPTGTTSISCDMEPNDILVLVHSAPDNFSRRKTIRETWGSRRLIGGMFWKTVFLVGQVGTYVLQRELELESKKHGDVIQGNFTDSYRNLTLKHLMGYDWTRKYCPNVGKLLKTDDDVFVNPFRVVNLLTETLKNTDMSRTIVCSVVSEGTLPIREGTRWVSKEEYPFDTYPTYCSGLAYLIGSSLSRNLLRLSQYVPRFWVDDVYVTGMLVSLMKSRCNVLPYNVRYTDSSVTVSKWLLSNVTQDFPYAFAEVSRAIPNGTSYITRDETIRALWKKTLNVRESTTTLKPD